MAIRAPGSADPPPPTVPIHKGGLRGLVRTVPTALVLAGLAGVACWGYATGWNFVGETPAVETASGSGSPVGRPTVRFVPGGADGSLPLPGQNVRIEFGSSEEVEKAGIGISAAWVSPLSEQATAPGEVSFDPTRLARVSARVGGVMRRAWKSPGESVRAGETIALVDAPEVGKAKAEFQLALVQARHRERTRDDLAGAGSATSPAVLREAEASAKETGVRLLAAVQTLANLGLPLKPDEYRRLAPADAVTRLRHLGVEHAAKDFEPVLHSANSLPIRAPFAGVVLSADAVAGETVEAGKPLFVIVDASRVWITLHVGPEEARRVVVGQKVFFRPDGGTREHPAAVVWVGTAADEATRTIPVRAEADNPAGALKASALGRGRVIVREEPKALVVPHEALRAFRGKSVVFVRDPDFMKASGPKAFHVRMVRVGGRDERNTEILGGLANGEIVATGGSGSLLDELAGSAAGR